MNRMASVLEAALREAREADHRKQWEQAVERWSRVITLVDESTEPIIQKMCLTPRLRRSEALRKIGRPAEAAEDLQVLVRLRPTEALFWARLAKALAAVGTAREEGLRAMIRAAALDPNAPGVRQLFEEVGATIPESSILTRCADTLEQAEQAEAREQWPEAITAWTDSFRLTSDIFNDDMIRSWMLLRRAMAFGHQKEYKRCQDDAENALSLNDESAGIWAEAAVAFLLAGKEKRAVDAIRQAIAIDPEDKTVKSVFAQMVDASGVLQDPPTDKEEQV